MTPDPYEKSLARSKAHMAHLHARIKALAAQGMPWPMAKDWVERQAREEAAAIRALKKP